MTIDIGDVSVSIPTFISEWANSSEDNRTEFDGMIETMMYAVNKVCKERYKQNPYQKLYEKQMGELMDMGFTHESATMLITEFINYVMTHDRLELNDIEKLINL